MILVYTSLAISPVWLVLRRHTTEMEEITSFLY
jgi:hypothetical protein